MESLSAMPSLPCGIERAASSVPARSSMSTKDEKAGPDGVWSVLSLVRAVPRIVNDRRAGWMSRDFSRGRGGCLSKIRAAVDDGSGRLPSRVGGERAHEDHAPGNGGVLGWFTKFVAQRTAQKQELTDSLKRYGVAGILSYGLLNTAYYLVTFLFVWLYVAPSPGGLGFASAAKRFLSVFATVWAGSQVTKLFRAAGALSLAPLVDRGLNWCTHRFNFKSRGTAFTFLVSACFGLSALVFLVITVLWS